jgi:hypothetical protein
MALTAHPHLRLRQQDILAVQVDDFLRGESFATASDPRWPSPARCGSWTRSGPPHRPARGSRSVWVPAHVTGSTKDEDGRSPAADAAVVHAQSRGPGWNVRAEHPHRARPREFRCRGVEAIRIRQKRAREDSIPRRFFQSLQPHEFRRAHCEYE